MGHIMSVGHRFSVELHLPPATISRLGQDREEVVQRLPPPCPCDVHLVEDYPAARERWGRELIEGGANYLCGVSGRRGLWFDLNGLHHDSHHIATVINIQGVNAVSGPGTSVDDLQQYRRNCPIHGTPFESRDGKDYFCSSCDFPWPPQNYLASNATPQNLLWLDGWRDSDGVVRQAIFTDDESEGVAAQTIGEARTNSIDLTFYSSKQPKPQPKPVWRDRFLGGGDSECHTYGGGSKGINREFLGGSTRSLEVAAGAKIVQGIYRDPENVDTFWSETAAGKIRLFFVPMAEVARIIASQSSGGGGSFLSRLKTGNSRIS